MPRITSFAGFFLLFCIALAAVSGCTSDTRPETTVPATETPSATLPATVTSPPVTTLVKTPVTLPSLKTPVTTRTTQAGLDDCVTDADCVPACGCRVERCINKAWKQPCEGYYCLMIVDPDPRHCECIDRECKAVSGAVK